MIKNVKSIDGHNYWPLVDQNEDGFSVTNINSPLRFKKRREIVMQINPELRLWDGDPRNFNSTWDTRVQVNYKKYGGFSGQLYLTLKVSNFKSI